MYIYNLVVVLCVLGVVKAYQNNDDDLLFIDSIQNEPSCSSQGGMCTIAMDCKPGGLVEQDGLCPAQRSWGVECCHGISEKETRCRKRGGECMEGCSRRLIDIRATDCPKDTVCCILN